MTDRAKTRLLVISLLCNGLLAGFVLGQFRGEAFVRSIIRSVQEAVDIPSAVDTVIAGAFDTERFTIADAVRQTRDAQEDAAAAVRREPLDLDRVDEALARVRAGDEALTAAVHRALRSAAAKLDPKGRDAVADVIERAPPTGGTFGLHYRWSYLRKLPS